MKGLICKSILFFVVSPLFALKSDPWIPPPYELNAGVDYAFSYFPSVNSAINPVSYDSYVNELTVQINGAFTTEIFCELEVEFDSSSKLPFNFESVAPCIKYQMLNDLTGDAMALLVGTYFRYVPNNRLTDVATPYSGEYNFDFLLSVGKEFDKDEKMVGRAYGLFDVGIATVGMPWVLADVIGEAVFYQRNFLQMGIDGFFGFGDQRVVDIDNFNGYGNIKHSSLNVKVGYAYKFSVWGEIAFLYKRRVVAIAYPSDTDYYGLTYNLSFSF